MKETEAGTAAEKEREVEKGINMMETAASLGGSTLTGVEINLTVEVLPEEGTEGEIEVEIDLIGIEIGVEVIAMKELQVHHQEKKILDPSKRSFWRN